MPKAQLRHPGEGEAASALRTLWFPLGVRTLPGASDPSAQPCPHSRPSTHVWFAQDHANLSLPHENPQCRAGAEPPGTQHSSAERNVLSLLAG